jgi:hypothetical protein
MHGEPDIDTIQIEIINLETEMGYNEGSPYNEETISVIKIIETDKNKEFLSDLKYYSDNGKITLFVKNE